jgi:hypothetical protein
MKKRILIASILLLTLVLLAVAGCSPQAEGFAIYLTKDDIPVAQMEALSHVELADTPIISMDDINSYYWDSHQMALTHEAYRRIVDLNVPTSGISFVVCVNKTPVYWGAFWTPLSSQSFNGIAIMVLPGPEEHALKLQLGYPGLASFSGEDPRDNPDIMQALEKADKLKTLTM